MVLYQFTYVYVHIELLFSSKHTHTFTYVVGMYVYFVRSCVVSNIPLEYTYVYTLIVLLDPMKFLCIAPVINGSIFMCISIFKHVPLYPC